MAGLDERLRTQLADGIRALNLACTETQIEQLWLYLQLLVKWNKAYNLTAVRDPEEMVSRHLLDSLSIASYIEGSTLVDVGTGPGLPGIPLAILFPDRQFLLVDSNGKKTRFLTQCCLDLKLANLKVRQARIEELTIAPPDAITSRAFASIADFVCWTDQLVGPQTRLYAMKGQYPVDEIAAMPDGFQVVAEHPLRVPGCEGERHLLIIARAKVPASR